MQSLIVVSLPRSLSSVVYDVVRRSLGLREPTWTRHGEILNVDQMAAYLGPRFEENAKFTTPAEPALFDKLGEFLDQVVQPTGFAYKDVTQPFVVANWLPRHDVKVLRLDRSVTDVAFAMLATHWYYPRHAAPDAADREGAVIEGLLRAELVLAGVPGESLSFRDLVEGEQYLDACLARLYPDAARAPVRYRDDAFVRETRRQLARRLLPAYRKLDERVTDARERKAASELVVARHRVPARDRPYPPWLAERARRLICDVLPRDAAVVLVSDDEALLNLEGRRAWLYPDDDTAAPVPVYADTSRAFAQLESYRERGATHVVVPVVPGGPILVPAEVADFLLRSPVVYEDETCRIIAFTDAARG